MFLFIACAISVNGDLLEPQPLILVPGGGNDANSAFFLPGDESGTISFNDGQAVDLACPGGFLLQDGIDTGLATAQITCVGDKIFNFNGADVAFNTISCSTYPFHTARYTGNNCLNQYREIEIGFEIDSRFIKHITVCFDDIGQNTIYTEFDLTSTIAGYQSGFPRPSFIEGNFYDVGSETVEHLYTRNQQRITINGILGLPSDDTQYIHATNDFFMARGHLTAKADFVFGAQHRLTFYYINCVPQWQTFNGGNWVSLEQDVRDLASSRTLDLVVYTGGHGVTTLPDVNGVDQELYLYVDSNKGLPVPQFTWKVVYDPASRAGVALFGVNNPYHADLSEGNFCTDVCSQITWLTWQPTDQTLGFSYCCAVDDFRGTVTTVPQLQVDSLLT